MAAETAQAFHFPAAGRSLFGFFHPAEGTTERRTVMVLCPPFGHEYVAFHHACRQLATRLAKTGFPVLRFDFYGCGDASGESSEGRLGRWVADAREAVGEAKRRSGCDAATLIGLRLGGTVAALAANGCDDVDALVLWDPIASGVVHARELLREMRRMLTLAHVLPRGGPLDTDPPSEILGFPMPRELWEEIRAIDLTTIERTPASRMLLLETTEEESGLAERLRELGGAFDQQRKPDPAQWRWNNDVMKIHLPHATIQAIVSWAARTDSP